MLNRNAKKYPYVTKVLNQWVKDHCKAHGIAWTTFTVNHGWESARHRDRNNVGKSIIVTIGDHQAGGLKIWDEDDRKGDVMKLRTKDAKVLHPRKTPLVFDGTQAHETVPFIWEPYLHYFLQVKMGDVNEL